MCDLKTIFSKFDIECNIVEIAPFGMGHINETYLVTCEIDKRVNRYILQKINSKLFNVEKLMQNIGKVSQFVYEKLLINKDDTDKRILRFFLTKEGLPYYFDKETEGYFRVFNYIENSIAYQKVESPNLFYQSALAFGDFANLLADFDASQLYDILPDFHNTPKRYQKFLNALNSNSFNRAGNIPEEINFVIEREEYCSKITKLLDSHIMPLRVTHNDTKLNNVLLDKDSGKYITVIDLDTIMSGSLCYDFGDAIRFGCNTGAEDERNLDLVHFDITLFEAFTKGYLESVGNSISKVERENLAFGAILMTYECGMRFLTDYLEGDSYFRVSRLNQNLDRARTQFKLVKEMEDVYSEMLNIVMKY